MPAKNKQTQPRFWTRWKRSGAVSVMPLPAAAKATAPNESILDVAVRLSDGLPGAIYVLGELFKMSPAFITVLDRTGLRRGDIWDLYKTTFDEDINRLAAHLREEGKKLSTPEERNMLVPLKDGARVRAELLSAVHDKLKGFFSDGFKGLILAYELREICRNPNHTLFGGTGKDLRAAGLLGEDGNPDEEVRKVVNNSFEGESTEMRLVSPLALSLAN